MPGAKLPTNPQERTAFRVPAETGRAADLTLPSFDQDSAAWGHPTNYGPYQDFADAARTAGIAAIRHRSVRDHDGGTRGAERIAACWADARKVLQVVFKPDWTRYRNAAPFKRNDKMLEAMPIGVVAFPGSGISDNLADKARTLGIPVWRFPEQAPAKAGDGAT